MPLAAAIVAIAAALIVALVPSAALAKEGTPTGHWGTCPYWLDSKGNLVVGAGTPPAEGGSQITLLYNVKTVSFEKGFTLPEDSDSLFRHCSAESIDLTNVDASHVVDADNMFSECSKLKSIDMHGLDFSHCKTAYYLFAYCDSLETANLSGVNFSGVFKSDSETEDLISMFYWCHSLKSVDLSNLKAPNVRDFTWLFKDCPKLEKVNLSGMDMSSATNLQQMFAGDESLTEVDFSGVSPMRNLVNLKGMFSGCSSLKSVNLSTLQSADVAELGDMFSGCSSLKSVDISAFHAPNATNIGGMFSSCSSLESLDLSNIGTSKLDHSPHGWEPIDDMLKGCTSLRELKLSAGFFASESVDIRAKANLPEIAQTDIYTGKWVREDGSKPAEGSKELVSSGDASLAGTWIWQTYATVSFDANGGSGAPNPVRLGWGVGGDIPEAAPTRKGYDFAGWNTAADGSGTAVQAGGEVYPLKGDVTLYAQWKEQQFGLTYDPAGGTFADGTTTKRTDSFGRVTGKATIAEAPTRSGYTFVCWRDKAGNEFKPGDAYELKGDDGLFADDELAAVWKKDATKPTPDGDKGESTPSKQTQSTNGNAKAQTAAKAAPAKAATAKVSSKVPLTGDTTSQAAPTLLAVALASVCGGLALRARRHE